MSSSSVSNRNKFTYVGWSKTMYDFKIVNKTCLFTQVYKRGGGGGVGGL